MTRLELTRVQLVTRLEDELSHESLTRDHHYYLVKTKVPSIYLD